VEKDKSVKSVETGYRNTVSELIINTWSDIIKQRFPNSFQRNEEDTYEVEASN
jgi:hypothetical protein